MYRYSWIQREPCMDLALTVKFWVFSPRLTTWITPYIDIFLILLGVLKHRGFSLFIGIYFTFHCEFVSCILTQDKLIVLIEILFLSIFSPRRTKNFCGLVQSRRKSPLGRKPTWIRKMAIPIREWRTGSPARRTMVG